MRAGVAYGSSRTRTRCRKTFQRHAIPMRERRRLAIGASNETPQCVVRVCGLRTASYRKKKLTERRVIKGRVGAAPPLP